MNNSEPRGRISKSPNIQVLRHKAAIRRKEPSLPLKCLLRDQLLTEHATFFDYGCGYGDDLRHASSLGIRCEGWDPAFRPATPPTAADVVNLGYVINVIEDGDERRSTLREAWTLAGKLLVVSARVSVDDDTASQFAFGDGVITRLQTFQKFFTHTELKQYIESTLEMDAYPAAPGVFYVFREALLRSSFLTAKYRTRETAPRARKTRSLNADDQAMLQELLEVSSQLGREPFEDEYHRSKEITSRFGSIKRAFALVRASIADSDWDIVRRKRSDDLLVFLALSKLNGRPRLAQLPPPTQRDIRAFYGGYKTACDTADALLAAAGQPALVDAACQSSTIGRLTSNALYIHASTIAHLEPILRLLEGCARSYLGDIDDANVIKLHRYSGKVSYLACPDFASAAHPAIRRTIKLSLRRLHLSCHDHADSPNPLLLDQKELFIEGDHPWRERFAKFTMQEMRHGLLQRRGDFLQAREWQLKLEDAGVSIRGHRLVYLPGAKRKRLLPPIQQAHAKTTPAPPQLKLSELDNTERLDRVATAATSSPRVSKGKRSGLPTRSRLYGVGKEIAGSVYVHRTYEASLGPIVDWAKRRIPCDYVYDVVKLNRRAESVSFVSCPSFDTEHEPTILGTLTVNSDGTVTRIPMATDPFIYHHKWLFVADDYAGFDVESSVARSLAWTALDNVDRSRIGRQSYWQTQVAPRIQQPTAKD